MFHIGVVHTSSIRPWNKPAKENPLPVKFVAPFPSPPPVLTGLNNLDIGNQSNFRISCVVRDIRTDGMMIDMQSWASTVQYGSGCAWLVPPATDTDFQYGHFATMEDHPWHKPQKETTRRIAFARRYTAPPKVVVWLDLLDIDKDANCRVRAYPTDVTKDGFTIHIDSWASTKLYGVGAFWAAHSAERKDICSGTFGTADIRRWDEPRVTNFSTTFFKSANFSQPPRVFLAFNSLDIDCRSNLRVCLSAANVMSAGMIWHINSWASTTLYSAGASFIAVP